MKSLYSPNRRHAPNLTDIEAALAQLGGPNLVATAQHKPSKVRIGVQIPAGHKAELERLSPVIKHYLAELTPPC